MTEAEIAQLETLLQKLRTDDLLPPKTPYGVWKALHGIVPVPCVEVIVTTTGKNFLLTYRKDEHWDGWHIPGGYMHHKESVADACTRIGRKELDVDVTFTKVIGAHMWQNHPYSSALSVLCVCTAKEMPKVGEWFTEIPASIILNQGGFLETFLSQG